MISNIACEEDEQDGWREGCQAQICKSEGVSGDVIDIPGDGDLNDLIGEGVSEPGTTQEREIAVTKGCPTAV